MTGIHDELSAAIRDDEPVVLATLVSGEPSGARLLVYESGRLSGTLGHASLDATQIYAEKSAKAAIEVASKMG